MEKTIVIKNMPLNELRKKLKRLARKDLAGTKQSLSLNIMETREADHNIILIKRGHVSDDDFLYLCDTLFGELADEEVEIKAWFTPSDHTLQGLPRHQDILIEPKPAEEYSDDDGYTLYSYLKLIAPDGTLFQEDEEAFDQLPDDTTVETCFKASEGGQHTYTSFSPVKTFPPSPENIIDISEKLTLGQKLYARYILLAFGGSKIGKVIGYIGYLIGALVPIVAFFALVIIAVIGAWAYNDTLLPFVLPLYQYAIIIVGISLIASVVHGIWKSSRRKNSQKIGLIWSELKSVMFLYTLGIAISIGILQALIFGINKNFGSENTEYREAIVREVDEDQTKKGEPNNNVLLYLPQTGIYIYHHVGQKTFFKPGMKCRLKVHRGLFGMYVADELEDPFNKIAP